MRYKMRHYHNTFLFRSLTTQKQLHLSPSRSEHISQLAPSHCFNKAARKKKKAGGVVRKRSWLINIAVAFHIAKDMIPASTVKQDGFTLVMGGWIQSIDCSIRK